MTAGQQGTKYDLNKIYRDVFGHVRPPYPTLVIQSRTLGVSPVGTVRSLRGLFNFSSKLGTQLTMPTVLGGVQLPNEPSMEISGGKRIIETQLTRLDSVGLLNKQNVLEEINLNNFRLRIRGIMINEEDPDDYPEEQMRELRDVLLRAGSVPIQNDLCTMWGIGQMAIEDFRFHEVKGNIAVQGYEIIGCSDEYIELEVNETPERV